MKLHEYPHPTVSMNPYIPLTHSTHPLSHPSPALPSTLILTHSPLHTQPLLYTLEHSPTRNSQQSHTHMNIGTYRKRKHNHYVHVLMPCGVIHTYTRNDTHMCTRARARTHTHRHTSRGTLPALWGRLHDAELDTLAQAKVQHRAMVKKWLCMSQC